MVVLAIALVAIWVCVLLLLREVEKRTWLSRLLCRLGIHDWDDRGRLNYNSAYRLFVCRRCQMVGRS